MRPNPQFPADLVTFSQKILNGKLHFFCSLLPQALTVIKRDMPRAGFKMVQNLVPGPMNKKFGVVINTQYYSIAFKKRTVLLFVETHCEHSYENWNWILPSLLSMKN